MKERKPRGYWTYERIEQVAKSFTTKKAFREGGGSAYKLASQKKILDSVCSHMDVSRKPNGFGC